MQAKTQTAKPKQKYLVCRFIDGSTDAEYVAKRTNTWTWHGNNAKTFRSYTSAVKVAGHKGGFVVTIPLGA